MSVELDGLALISHVRDEDTGQTKLLNSIANLNISERRRIVEQRIPRFEGNILQDLGREPVRISFNGLIYGEEAKVSLERLRAKFTAGEPLPFNSDISGVAEVSQVLIEEFRVQEVGGSTNTYHYEVVLKEYILPEEEEEPAPSQEDAAEEAVEEAADDAAASVNYITGKVVDAEGNPQSGVNVKITWDSGEYTVQTDAEGIYRKDDLDPGTYTVTVDASGYEEQEEIVEITSASSNP